MTSLLDIPSSFISRDFHLLRGNNFGMSTLAQLIFLTFPACFLIPIIFSNLNSNCSNLLDMRNLQEQVKKAFCYQKLFWHFTVWTNCSSDLKIFANSRPSALNFKSFSRSLEQFFLTVGQNNFGNKIPLLFFKLQNASEDKDLKCFYAHNNSPWLKLAPIKIEPVLSGF